MSLYRVLLVDDEEEIRIGIEKKIDWELLGLNLVGNASNGLDALDMATILHPDIVLTDIKMPYMDGLELCKKLSEHNPSVKLVVFSGFDEFAYAKQAMKYNAAAYILKPVNSVELSEILINLKRTLDAELDAKRDLESLREYYINSLPLMREQFLVRLVEGRVSLEQLSTQATQFDVCLDGGYHGVVVFRADLVSKPQDLEVNYQKELIPLWAKRIVDEGLTGKFSFQSFMYGENIVAIIALESRQQILEIVDEANHICKQACRLLQFTLCAGVGSVCDVFSSLHHSYQTALNAMDYRVILGGSKAIYIDDLEPNICEMIEFEEQDERSLVAAIKLGSADSMKETVCKIIGHLREKRATLEACQSFLMGIMSTLTKLVRGYQLDQSIIFGKNFKGYVYVGEFSSLEELKDFLLSSCLKINELICEVRINSVQAMAKKAKLYIEENYGLSTMSVETLCEYLHLSPAYFSTIFKRETGMNFISYLTAVRLEAATRLLKTTDDKTQTISQKVGYTDANYFSYVFKKAYGVSPSKYRE